MAKILGWAQKDLSNNQLVERFFPNGKGLCPEFHYTDEQKKVRIQSILNENPTDALKLIQSVLDC